MSMVGCCGMVRSRASPQEHREKGWVRQGAESAGVLSTRGDVEVKYARGHLPRSAGSYGVGVVLRMEEY